jgi:carbamoylphosphate synthase small subunit
VSRENVRQAYQGWAQERRIRTIDLLDAKDLAKTLRERGAMPCKIGKDAIRGWRGVRLAGLAGWTPSRSA